MSKKYNNNIGYDKRDDYEFSMDGGIQFSNDKTPFISSSRMRNHNTNVDRLVEEIFDTIKECREELSVPIFDEHDFGYFYIYEYLKLLDIQ